MNRLPVGFQQHPKPSNVSEIIDQGTHSFVGLLRANPACVLKWPRQNEDALKSFECEKRALAIVGQHSYIVQLLGTLENGLCFEYHPLQSMRHYYTKSGLPPLVNVIDGAIKPFPVSHISIPKTSSIMIFLPTIFFCLPIWLSKSVTLVRLHSLERKCTDQLSFDIVLDEFRGSGRRLSRVEYESQTTTLVCDSDWEGYLLIFVVHFSVEFGMTHLTEHFSVDLSDLLCFLSEA